MYFSPGFTQQPSSNSWGRRCNTSIQSKQACVESKVRFRQWDLRFFQDAKTAPQMTEPPTSKHGQNSRKQSAMGRTHTLMPLWEHLQKLVANTPVYVLHSDGIIDSKAQRVALGCSPALIAAWGGCRSSGRNWRPTALRPPRCPRKPLKDRSPSIRGHNLGVPTRPHHEGHSIFGSMLGAQLF